MAPICFSVDAQIFGVWLIFVAQNDDEIPPNDGVGGVMFAVGACGCCVGAFNEGFNGVQVVDITGTGFLTCGETFLADWRATRVGSID